MNINNKTSKPQSTRAEPSSTKKKVVDTLADLTQLGLGLSLLTVMATPVPALIMAGVGNMFFAKALMTSFLSSFGFALANKTLNKASDELASAIKKHDGKDTISYR